MAVKNLTVRDAWKQMDTGSQYVDVRSIQEFEQGHPTGAVNVPLLHFDERTGQMVPNHDFLAVMQANFNPDAKLLLGCKMGGRSAQAAQLLEAAGFRDVTNVTGGFSGARDPVSGAVRAEGWQDAGLPVETTAPADHCYQALQQKVAGGS